MKEIVDWVWNIPAMELLSYIADTLIVVGVFIMALGV